MTLISRLPHSRNSPIHLSVLAIFAFLTLPVSAAEYNFTKIVDNGGGFSPDFSALGQRKINDSGEVTFVAEPSFAQHRIYKSSGGGVHIHMAGPPNYFGLSSVGNGAISESGDVTFVGSRQAFENGIYRSTGTSFHTIQQDTNASHLEGSHRHFLDVSVSDSGHVAYRGASWACSGEPVTCGPETRATHVIFNGNHLSIESTGGVWSDVGQYAPVINDAVQVLFTMRAASDGNTHLLHYSNGISTPLDTDFVGGKGYWMNNLGDAVSAEGDAITLHSGGASTTIASTSDGFDSLMKVGTGEAFINDSGQIAFWGDVNSYNGNPVTWEGVFTGPDILNDRVLVAGDHLMGHTISSVSLLGLNNSGQILMSVEALTPDTWRALVVASPKLPGDYNLDGNVDAADYVVWSKGIAPYNMPSDYSIWSTNFGNPNSGAGGSANVPAAPEPPAVVIMCIAVLAIPQLKMRHNDAP